MPVATTVNVAVSPTRMDWLAGWVVMRMAGGLAFTVMVRLAVVLPAVFTPVTV